MKIQIAALAAAFVIGPSALAQTYEYRIEGSRVYGDEASDMAMIIESEARADGPVRRAVINSQGAVFADTVLGVGVGGAKPLSAFDMQVSYDRARIDIAGRTERASAPAEVAAAAGRAAGQGGACRLDEVRVSLPVDADGAPESVDMTASARRMAGGACLMTFESAHLIGSGPGGGGYDLRVRGGVVWDRAMQDVLLLAVAHEGVVSGEPVQGLRSVVLAARDGRDADAAIVAAALERLDRFGVTAPGADLDGARNEIQPEDARLAADALHAANIAFYVGSQAAVFGEGAVNPAWLAAIPVIWAVDQFSASLVSATGAAVKAGGVVSGSDRLTRAGEAMGGYNGVIGETAEWGGGYIGARFFGDREGGERTVEAAFDTVGLFTGRAVSQGVNRGFAYAITRSPTRSTRSVFRTLQRQTRVRPSIEALSDAAGWINYGVSRYDDVRYIRDSLNANSASRLNQNAMQRRADSLVSPTRGAGGLLARTRAPQPYAFIPGVTPAYLGPVIGRRSTYVTDARGDFAQSTAGFADVVIAGILAFRLFDFGVEDGDVVTLDVSNEGRLLLGFTTTLTNAGEVFTVPGAREGSLVLLRLTANNEGSISPNTGGVEVTSVVLRGDPSQQYSLRTGQSGVFRIFIAGRRAK